MIPTQVYLNQNQYSAGGPALPNPNANELDAGAGHILMQQNPKKITILQRPHDPNSPQNNQAQSPQRIVYPATPPRQEQPAPLKTPLALLNEICSKHRIIPKRTMNEEGSPSARTFSVTMGVEYQGDAWEGIGKARNLQAAKQEAARNLLINIDPKNERMLAAPVKEEASTENSGANASPSAAPTSVPALEGNPIGDLGELCMKFKLPMPGYTESIDGGGFIFNCIVEGYANGSGQASTKKVAKKISAAEALKNLTEQLKSQIGQQLSSDDVDLKGMAKLFQTKLNISSAEDANTGVGATNASNQQPAQNPSSNAKFASLADKLYYFRSSMGSKVDFLTKTNIKELQKRDPTEVLTDLCDEQKWKLEFVEVEPTEEEPKYRSLVSCTVEGHSLFLLSGLGSSAAQARKSAVVELLGMLRHLLRK